MLARHDAAVAEERNSRKEPLTDDDVHRLLAGVEVVLVARGRHRNRMRAAEASLDDLKGPTGKYRAPMVQAGHRLLVGFHPETLEEFLSG